MGWSIRRKPGGTPVGSIASADSQATYGRLVHHGDRGDPPVRVERPGREGPMVTVSIVIVLGPAVRVTAKRWDRITTSRAGRRAAIRAAASPHRLGRRHLRPTVPPRLLPGIRTDWGDLNRGQAVSVFGPA